MLQTNTERVTDTQSPSFTLRLDFVEVFDDLQVQARTNRTLANFLAIGTELCVNLEATLEDRDSDKMAIEAANEIASGKAGPENAAFQVFLHNTLLPCWAYGHILAA